TPGSLATGTTASSKKPVGVKVPSGVKVKSVAEGCFHSLALTTTGTLLAWRENSCRQLGTRSTADSDVRASVDMPPALAAPAIGSAPAAQHSLAIFAPGGCPAAARHPGG